jgi:SulP family sulfate permease
MRKPTDLRHDLEAAGLVDRIGEDRIFMTLPTAVQAYLRWYLDRHGAPPPGLVLPEPSVGPVVPPRLNPPGG